MSTHQADWRVLLIGGASGTGKTLVASQLGLRFGVSWLQVDDLRLALQYSQVALPQRTEELYFFMQTPDVWTLPAEQLRDALIAVGEIMTPAIEIVVASHVDTIAPVVIEGDGILPSFFAAPLVGSRAKSGFVRGVFLTEPDEDILLANTLARARGITGVSEEELRAEAHTKWMYNNWIAGEATRYSLPVVHSRPWPTLVERIIAALNEESDADLSAR